MINQGGAEEKPFREGTTLGASDLQKIIDGVVRRIVGLDPISVRAIGQNLTISWRDESVRKKGGGGGSSPVIITSLESPDPVNLPGYYTVDVYDNGYDAAPTFTSVAAYPLFPVSNYAVGDHAFVFVDNGTFYLVDVQVSFQQCFPAKVVLVISTTVVQVDIYENGYSHIPTLTARLATIVDQNTWGNLVAGDDVSVFVDKGVYWVSSTKPFNPDALPPIMDGRISSVNGDGTYGWKQTLGPGLADVTGAVERQATEWAKSVHLQVDDHVGIYNVGVNGFRINKPLKTCAL